MVEGESSGAHSWHFAPAVPATAAAEAPPPALCERLRGRFELLATLGKGGMGAVYRGRDLRTGREVALKVVIVPPTRQALARFQREGELAAALRHPGLVTVHEVGEVDGRPYLVYELVPGARPLTAAVHGAPRAEVLRLVRDAAVALGHAHAQGVVHRDVKPDNILVDEAGRVRVTDFGLAWVEGAEPLTRTGGFVGTPSYMAPEQLVRGRDPLGPAADVWSLGVVLYECLLGRLPFVAPTLPALAAQVVACAPEAPRAVDPTLPADVEAVVLRALARAPGDRHPDGAALAADLDAALAGRPVARRTRWRPGRARRLVTAAAAGAAALVAAGLGLRAVEDARLGGLARAVEGGADPAALEARLGAGGDPAGGVGLASRGARRLARLALADAALRTGRPDEALAHAGPVAEAPDAAPALRARAERQRAAALAARGALAAAAAALERAHALEGRPEDLVAAAAAHRRAGDLRRALAVARAAAGAPGAGGAATRLLAELELAAGDRAVARALAERRAAAAAAEPADALLLAHVLEVGGEDAGAVLAGATQAWPLDGDVAAARAAHALARGDPWGAAALAQQARGLGAGGAALDEVEGAARAATAGGPGAAPPEAPPAPAAPAAARALARWWLLRAEQEAALADEARGPFAPARPGAVPGADRDRRAAGAARAALGLLAAEAPPPRRLLARAHGVLARAARADLGARAAHVAAALAAWPVEVAARRLRAEDLLAGGRPAEALALLAADRSAAARRLLGRALVGVGRLAEGARALEAAAALRAEDAGALRLLAAGAEAAGDRPAAAGWRARAEGLERPDPRAAKDILDEVRRDSRWLSMPAAAVLERCARAAEVAPYSPGPRLFAAELRLRARDFLQGARDLERALRHAPEELGSAQVLLFQRGASGLGELASLAADLPFDGSDEDAAARALLLAAAVEFERRADLAGAALAALDAALAADPGHLTAWALHGLVALRAGQLERAAWDLAVVEGAAPGCAPASLYRALLAGARRAPAREVLAAVETAWQRGYMVWDRRAWTPDLYPEMAPYRDVAGADAFFAPQRRRLRAGEEPDAGR